MEWRLFVAGRDLWEVKNPWCRFKMWLTISMVCHICQSGLSMAVQCLPMGTGKCCFHLFPRQWSFGHEFSMSCRTLSFSETSLFCKMRFSSEIFEIDLKLVPLLNSKKSQVLADLKAPILLIQWSPALKNLHISLTVVRLTCACIFISGCSSQSFYLSYWAFVLFMFIYVGTAKSYSSPHCTVTVEKWLSTTSILAKVAILTCTATNSNRYVVTFVDLHK